MHGQPSLPIGSLTIQLLIPFVSDEAWQMGKGVLVQTSKVKGRIDEAGRVLLPVILIASDGLEIEVECIVNLEFDGALAISEELAHNVGWRCLGGRRVMMGKETKLMEHYIGTIILSNEPINLVVLGGGYSKAILGHKLLADRRLTVDFRDGTVELA
jgi:predicted aspartyl protease